LDLHLLGLAELAAAAAAVEVVMAEAVEGAWVSKAEKGGWELRPVVNKHGMQNVGRASSENYQPSHPHR
jgi:hypothetical protein